MNFSNTPRKYLLGLVLVMVLILVTIVATNPGSLVFKNNIDYDAQRKIAEEQTREYEDLLASVEPNYAASQQLLEKIATEDVVRREVELALGVNQKITVPTIADAELTFSERNDRAAMVDYLNRLGSVVTNYNKDVQPAVSQVFADSADRTAIASAALRTKSLADSIRGLPVPKDAANLQKAYIVTYGAYESFLGTADKYASGSATEPWPDVYGQYALIDKLTSVAKSELSRLTIKYALNVPMPKDLAFSADELQFPSLIKTANAQWAVVDVQAAVLEGIKAGLARSFAKFAIDMLDKLVAHIEKNFAIASQLYYSQDLGRFYSVEYMKKFVANPLDQDIIQKFLPQYFCINPTQKELKQIFTAKAAANAGADIVIDPSDPQFIQKLARLGGDEKNYGFWWQEYYMSLAATIQEEASSAATKEVTSNGLKSGRDLATGQINKTMAAIFNTQEAAIAGTINLGTNNTENAIGQIVAGVVESLVNKFVFTPIGGGTSSGGGIGVIKETNVCLRTPQMKPVTSIPGSVYEAPKGSSTTTPPIVPTTTTPPFNPR